MATYGEGDPTDNAMEFYEWLKNSDLDLTGLNYAVSVLINISLHITDKYKNNSLEYLTKNY